MSDPQWPDLSAPYPGGGQQSQDPAAPLPSQPLAPYGSPDDAGQYGQQGQYGQPGQYGQYGQQTPAQTPNPYEQSGYQTGYPGAPYEQPGMPAYPPTPYGQPTMPSQPMYPYGQSGAPSQPLAPYDQFGQLGQFEPPSHTLPSGMPPAQRKRSLTWLWITLGVLVVLIAAGGGGAFYAVSQLAAPAAAATQFCTDLKAQSYDAAYSLLSSSLRTQYTHDQFVRGGQALDQLEGQVTACQPATSGGGYHHNFGASTATVTASLARTKQPTGLTGALHLVSEGGSWKISGIDTALLGVNLGALQTAIAFCTALQNKDYATATSLFGSSLNVAQSDWGTWDQIGGAIKTCTLQGLGTGNTDTAASFEIGVSRASSGTQAGALALTLESGTWKVSKLDSGVIGPDLGPLKVGTQFCQDILKANYSDAFGLLSSSLQQAVGSQDKLAQAFVLPSGVFFANCTAKLSTYKVSGGSGSYDATLELSNGSTTANIIMSLSFVQEGSGWKVDNWSFSLG